jgi:mannose-1-phosphate guanylyltransferase
MSHQPGLYKRLLKVRASSQIGSIWKNVEPVSFDCGILERSDVLSMLPAAGLGWSDLGSWLAYDEILNKDSRGNYTHGRVINLKSKAITVLGSKRLIAAVGLNDLIIVDSDDALLITKKQNCEEVKAVVEILKRAKQKEI